MSNFRRKSKLFDQGAQALRQLTAIEDLDICICPMCLKAFDRDHLRRHDDCDDQLKVEDAPPRQYQKQNLVDENDSCKRALTCGHCNGAAGIGVEKRYGDFLKYELPRIEGNEWERVRAGSVLGGRTTRFDMVTETRESGLIVPLFPGRTVSGVIAAASRDGSQIELKSAYIIACATLGHRYFLSSDLTVVREMIARPEGGVPEQICVNLPQDQPFGDYKVVEIAAPMPMILVTHPSPHSKDPGQHAVVLPRPGGGFGDEFYKALHAFNGWGKWGSQGVHDWSPSWNMTLHWDECNEHDSSRECYGVQDHDGNAVLAIHGYGCTEGQHGEVA